MKRRMRLRRSLAAKARGGGKVATMAQKFQGRHDDNDVVASTVSASLKSDSTEKMSETSSPPPSQSLPPTSMVGKQTVSQSTPLRVGSVPTSLLQPPVPLAGEDERKPAPQFQVKSSSSSESANSSLVSSSSSQTHPTFSTNEGQDTEQLRSERDDLHDKLKQYETDFVATHGREVKTFDDLKPVAQLYRRYLAIKKECAQRAKEKKTPANASNTSDSRNALSPAPPCSSASRTPSLEQISEGPSEHEVEETDSQSSPFGSTAKSSGSDTEDGADIYRKDKYIAIEPEKNFTEPKHFASSKSKSNPYHTRSGDDVVTAVVVSAVAAILSHDTSHKVEDPGDVVLIPGEETSSFCQAAEKEEDSIGSEPSTEPGYIASSCHQPFDEIMRPPPPRMSPEASMEETPEQSRKLCLQNVEESPTGVASFLDMFACKSQGDKASQYSSRPVSVEENYSFVQSVITELGSSQLDSTSTSFATPLASNATEKKKIDEENDMSTDLTFATREEPEDWAKMVDEMVQSLEDDVVGIQRSIDDSFGRHSDSGGNIASDKLRADASASKMSLVLVELDLLKAEFGGISKELASSKDRIKQLEIGIKGRDQAIAALQLQRDLAQADVKHLQDKLSRMQKEAAVNNSTNEKKMKSKDAQIARLNSTINKLRRELGIAKEAATTPGEDVGSLPLSLEARQIISGNVIPKTVCTRASGSRPSSPLYPDDEMDFTGGTNKNQKRNYLLAELASPVKPNQRSRAIDICKKHNKDVTDPSISSSINPSDHSETSSALEEALKYIRSFNAGFNAT